MSGTSTDPDTAAYDRQRDLGCWLIGMCDGRRYTLFDHTMAAEMLAKGWIARDLGSYVITDAGRKAAATGAYLSSRPISR